MITHFYYMTGRESVAVHIHEGDVLCPTIFAFADEPNVFYRRVEVSAEDEVQGDRCEGCDAGEKHCTFAPRCGEMAPVLSYSQNPVSLKIVAETIGATPHGSYVRFPRTYDYRPFALNTIPVITIDI